MARQVQINIVTALDNKGAKDAERLFKSLSKQQVDAAKAAAQVAAADAKVATAAAASARAQNLNAAAAARAGAAQSNQAAAAARAETAYVRLARAQERATAQADGFKRLAGSLGNVSSALGAVGVAVSAAGLVQFGADAIKMTAGLDTAQRSLKALAGSPKLYAEALETARTQQKLFGGSLQENIDGIQGLITVSRSSGVELQKLVDITQRLSIKDPAQGVAGARIALNEALAGDPVSLAKRYEIPKAALKELRDESTSAADKLAVIDRYLSGIGITSEVASGSVSPVAVSLNELSAAAEKAQVGIGLLLTKATGITEAFTRLFNWVGDGITVFSTIGDRAQALSGRILETADSFEDFSTKQNAAANELIKVGVVLPTLTQAQYEYAKSLMDSGVSATDAAAKATALAPALTQIAAVQNVLKEDTQLTAEQIAALGLQMGNLANAGGPTGATVLALAKALRTGSIDADEFLAALAQLQAATDAEANAAALAAQREGERGAATSSAAADTKSSADVLVEETEKKLASAKAAEQLAQFQEKLASLGDAVHGGFMTAKAAAAILTAQYGVAADEALRLIGLQAQLAGMKPVNFAEQRMSREERMANGGRGGQTTTAAIDFVRNAQKNAEAAQEARAAAARSASGGGRSGKSAAEREADKEAKAAERAAEQADDIRYRQAERERDLGDKRAAAAQERADKLASIDKDEGQRLADIAADTADKLASIETSAADKLTSIRAKRAADLKAIDQRAAAEQAQAQRDLATTTARSLAGLAASNAADNLALAGAGDDPALKAREAAQAARMQGTQAAAQRAGGFADATVGRAAFDAELQALDAKQQLDEEYAKRQEELAGNPQALAELDAYYQQAIDAQRAAVEQQIADAQAAADLRAQAREAEKQAVITAAEDERRAVVAEKQRQQAEVTAAAEKQRADVVAKAAEQRTAVETEFTKQNEAIAKWADDTERDLQRVIDKADEATRALLAVPAAAPGGEASTSAAPAPTVAQVTAAGGGTFVTRGPTRFTAGDNPGGAEMVTVTPLSGKGVTRASGGVLAFGGGGQLLTQPYLAPGMGAASMGAGGGLSVSLTIGSIVQQPGEDGALLAERIAAKVYQRLGSRMQGRGF